MSKSDSQKQSSFSSLIQAYRRLSGWQQWLVDLFFIAMLFILVSSWSSRHLLEEGTHLPELAVTSLEGESITLAAPAYRRTLVYVFAPWCSICRISMPGLSLIERPDLEQIALALDYENIKEVRQFIDDVGYTGKVALGDSQVAKALKIRGYPSYYLLDEKGQILHRAQGLTTPPGIWLNSL